MDEASLDRFRMTHSTLDDVDSKGYGVRLVFQDGVWRAWNVAKGRAVGKSSGGWNTMEEALAHLPRKTK